MTFATLVLHVVCGIASSKLDPAVPSWLSKVPATFRTKNDNRMIHFFGYDGVHQCNDESDPFISKGQCVTKAQVKFTEIPISPHSFKGCGLCQEQGAAKWSTYFCEDAPTGDKFRLQYAEYNDGKCQHVTDEDFSHMPDVLNLEPGCIPVDDPPQTCGSVCSGPAPSRYGPGCSERDHHDQATCEAHANQGCHWLAPPFPVKYRALYYTVPEQSHAAVV